jgi:hypothetical protein
MASLAGCPQGWERYAGARRGHARVSALGAPLTDSDPNLPEVSVLTVLRPLPSPVAKRPDSVVILRGELELAPIDRNQRFFGLPDQTFPQPSACKVMTPMFSTPKSLNGLVATVGEPPIVMLAGLQRQGARVAVQDAEAYSSRLVARWAAPRDMLPCSHFAAPFDVAKGSTGDQLAWLLRLDESLRSKHLEVLTPRIT